jgi:SAM-dependent methyltransferase
VGQFDLVVASHLLEHLENPHELLQSVREILTENGYLVVAVPNLDWWNPKHVYRSVSTLFDPEHAVGYSVKGLTKILKMNGYNPLRVTTKTYRLAIPTAIAVNIYKYLFGDKGNRNLKAGYNKAASEGITASILAYTTKPLNKIIEKGSRGMALLIVAKCSQ